MVRPFRKRCGIITYYLLGGIFLLLFLCHLLTGFVAFTGDEPRYFYYAVSFFQYHNFHMPEAEWLQNFGNLPTAFFPESPPGKIGHSVVISILISPFANFFSLTGARWFHFAVGLFGYLGIYQLLNRRYRCWVSLVVVLCASFSLPGFAYMKLVYSEIWLLTLVAWAWFLVDRPHLEARFALLTLILILCLPFFHLRMSLVSVTLLCFYLWRMRADEQVSLWLKCILPLSLSVTALGLFIFYQLTVFGSLTGSASAAYTPSFTTFFDRVALALFDLRHGLFVFAPIWILAFTGLVIGCVKREQLAIQAVLLLLAYMVVFVWGTASESISARFWVVALPMLAVGLAKWMSTVRALPGQAIGIPLCVLTFMNQILFIIFPNKFFENRQFSATYDFLFELLGQFHFGVFLPWDGLEFGGVWYAPHMEQSLRVAHYVTGMVGLIIVGQMLACSRSRNWVSHFGGLIALVVFAVLMSQTRVSFVRPAGYRVVVARNTTQPASLTIYFNAPSNPSLLRFGAPRHLWLPPLYPNEFIIETSTDNVTFREISRHRTSPLLIVPNTKRFSALRIIEGEKTELARWLDSPVEVFQRCHLMEILCQTTPH